MIPFSSFDLFLDPLVKNFQEAYHLAREISVDESMIGFKGRMSFVQYMPKKPTKCGMKTFVLTDSRTGYTCNWRLYTCKLINRHTVIHCTYILLPDPSKCNNRFIV